MNKRIFELAKQADLIQWDPLPSGARTPDYESVVKAQIFAELIVEECANFIEQDQDSGEVLANRLKQHFGVEE